jgi:RNA recognition motif-containing protein
MSIHSSSKQQNNKVFVSCIPKAASKADLINYFTNFGSIKSISSIFVIGKKKKRNRCAILESYDFETKQEILQEVHQIQKRYVDCSEYLRGKKLKRYISKIQQNNVYIPWIPKHTTKGEITRSMDRFGPVSKVKFGFSAQDHRLYAIVTFASRGAAEKALEKGVAWLKGESHLIKKYCETKQDGGCFMADQMETHRKKGISKALKSPRFQFRECRTEQIKSKRTDEGELVSSPKFLKREYCSEDCSHNGYYFNQCDTLRAVYDVARRRDFKGVSDNFYRFNYARKAQSEEIDQQFDIRF